MISPGAAAVMDELQNDFFVSEVSFLEVVLKHAAGRLPLPDVPRAWIAEKVHFHQLQTVPLTRDVIFRSGELPSKHADPFDRLLAAQAIEMGITLLSPDVSLSLLGASRAW